MEFIPYSRRLRDLAKSQSDALALVVETPDATEIYDFKTLNTKVDAFACALNDGGVDDNSAVIIVSPNSAATAMASAASWRLGAFCVCVSGKSSAQDLVAYINILRERYAHVVVVSDAVAPPAGTTHLPLEAMHQAVCDREVGDGNPCPARAIPSGGTTGRSKLIIDKNPMGYTEQEHMLSPMGWDDADSVLVYSPLYHNAGQGMLHNAIASGKKVVLMDRFDPLRAQHLLEKHSVEFFFAVPTHMQRFLKVEGLRTDAFKSVKSMYHAAAYCPPDLKQKWLDFLGPQRVWEAYGATEGTGMTAIRGDEWLVHRGSVGRPYNSEFRILDENENPLPTGEVGLIYTRAKGAQSDDSSSVYMGVSGPNVTSDGFRSVGDMGWLDDEGYLYIADRRTDMIITGGSNVFPAEVESTLCNHPEVSEAAVVGIPDEEWGRRVVALVVPTSYAAPPSPEVLDTFMSSNVVNYKKPKLYEFRDQLPYTEMGKLNRRLLTEECTARYSNEPVAEG